MDNLKGELEELRKKLAAQIAINESLQTELKKAPAEKLVTDPSLLAELERLRVHLADTESKLASETKLRKELEEKIKELLARIAELEALLAQYRQKEQEERDRIAREEAEARRRQEEEAKRAVNIKLQPLEQAEVTAYAHYINFCLAHDESLQHLLPINPFNAELLTKIKDGWIIAKFLNYAVQHTIDERALNRSPANGELSKAEVMENLTLCIESCRAINVQVNDINVTNIILPHHDPPAVISFIWRLIMTQLLLHINVSDHPELLRLLSPGQEATELLKEPPAQVLVRWINYHTANAAKKPEIAAVLSKHAPSANGNVSVASFLDEPFVQSSIVHSLLLHSLVPNIADATVIQSLLAETSLSTRVVRVLDITKRLGIPEAKEFISPSVLIQRGPVSARLALAFSSIIFTLTSGLEVLSNEELNKSEIMGDEGDSREERALRLWINSLNIGDKNDQLFIHNLFMECRDGIVLLRIIDRITPGSVDWKKVDLKPNNRFKKLGNCNEVIKLCKEKLHLSVVGIGGNDIVDGHKKFTVAIVWQLMHLHITEFLKEVHQSKFGAKAPAPSRRISVLPRQGGIALNDDGDSMIIEWANRRINELNEDQKKRAAGVLKGSSFSHPFEILKSFGDPRLSDSLFFLHLLWAIEPKSVNWNIVNTGVTQQDKIMNARYCISCARKLGATIFLLPEDIVEVKPKMITTFVSSILALDTLK